MIEPVSSDHLCRNQMAVTPLAPSSCLDVNSRSKAVSSCPFHHASPDDRYHTPWYDYHFPLDGSAINTTHLPSLSVNPHVFPPPEIRWLTIARSHFYPIPPVERSLSFMHLIQRLIPILCHARTSAMQSTHPNHAMHSKDEGNHLPVPGTLDHQQLHSRSIMAEKERYMTKQVNAFNGYGIASHIIVCLPEKYSRASKNINFVHYSKKLHSEVMPSN